jgi:hypothetical protein
VNSPHDILHVLPVSVYQTWVPESPPLSAPAGFWVSHPAGICSFRQHFRTLVAVFLKESVTAGERASLFNWILSQGYSKANAFSWKPNKINE